MREKKYTASDIRRMFRGGPSVEENGFRHYAVMIPMIVRDGEIHVMYEVRALDLDRQPGEICFPGGEVEPEESWQDCALRETWEEIGIPPESVELFDELTTIYGAGRFAMHCFPGLVDPWAIEQMQISQVEVERIFTIPLSDLMEASPEVYRARLIQYGPEDFPYDKVTGGDAYPWSNFTSPVPVYDVNGWIIWGLTGRVTMVLTEEIRKRSEGDCGHKA